MTENLHLIENLKNAAIAHKINCHDPHCNVSVFLLKRLAQQFRYHTIMREEKEIADKMIEEMPIE